VLYVVDLSGTCGYSLEQQAALFDSIKVSTIFLFLKNKIKIIWVLRPHVFFQHAVWGLQPTSHRARGSAEADSLASRRCPANRGAANQSWNSALHDRLAAGPCLTIRSCRCAGDSHVFKALIRVLHFYMTPGCHLICAVLSDWSVAAPVANKPLIVACNKTDLQPWETLPEEDKNIIRKMGAEAAECGGGLVLPRRTWEWARRVGPGEETLLFMSTMSDGGVVAVKNIACERLLQVSIGYTRLRDSQ